MYQSYSVNMSLNYDSDDILSQALDLYEEQVEEETVLSQAMDDFESESKLFITQNTFRSVPDDEKDDILHILKEAVDVTDFLQPGGPSILEATRSETKNKDCRFTVVTVDQLNVMSKQSIPENTARKNKLALNLLLSWREEILNKRSESCVGEHVRTMLEGNFDLLKLAPEHLNTIISLFILSLKKKNGAEYTGGSLFSVLTALQGHFQLHGYNYNFLSDLQFRSIKNCLDNSMQSRAKDGIGLQKRQAEVISPEKENILWEKGLLGDYDPKTLLNTEFWVIGLHFGLRGGVEHRNLPFDNFHVLTDNEGVEYLQYTEAISKTFNGGIKHRKLEPRKARAYASDNTTRCPVRIYKKYLSKLNPNADKTAFYFQPLANFKADIWYSLAPIGHNKLQNTIKYLAEAAGFNGFYTNHSLRATTATRLFHENVPEQLIMGQTGHRSVAIYNYKRPCDDQKREISKILQGVKLRVSCRQYHLQTPPMLFLPVVSFPPQVCSPFLIPKCIFKSINLKVLVNH